MKRHFYISENLDELEAVEHELEDQGVATPQIHVLSQRDADIQNHNLNEVEAVLKKDVVHSMELGAIIGVVAAILVLAIAYFAGWTESAAGWIPFIFLSIVVLGFCTWEGGLFGIQEPHYQFKQFQDALQQGKHIFFVDVTEQQEMILSRIVEAHPQLQAAGQAESTPEWVVEWQKNWQGFVKTMP
ncbi:NAD/FAD-utilizing enzyme [Oceanicoccus sagamiensis]|uniref:NAD/FAD-utilizing enzyme n=1 Tax=Oceanicoccus sagamiensis TaxID=716816 RepID=A0A1X9N558_9GAMM|nr:NAD/FAD-utilizing enzyme [Oceanicoccus sagamiensis]ARN72866.1 NAD/FAD-utilizing enzyme [Oceanicoccus sagamiensis]